MKSLWKDINVPKKRDQNTTVDKISAYACTNELSFDALKEVDHILGGIHKERKIWSSRKW